MAERVLVSPRKELRVSNDSDSPDEAVVPKRQKEMVKMRYSRRRRKLKKRIVKPQSNSSDSEPTASAKKSLELLSICDEQSLRYSLGGGSTSTYTLPHHESSFSFKRESTDPALDSILGDGRSSITKFNEFDFMLSQPNSMSNKNPAEENHKDMKFWYSGLIGSIYGFMSTRLFHSKPATQSNLKADEDYQLSFKLDFDENIEEMVKKVIQRVVEFCPDQYIEELNQRCIFQLKHKLNQRGVAIGISGKSQHGKNLLMKAIEKQSFESTSDVSYRMCSCTSSDYEGENSSEWYFLLEEATCAGLIHVLSAEDGLEAIESLKWLIERDKDVISQGRVLFLVNQTNTNDRHSFVSSLHLTIDDSQDVTVPHSFRTPIHSTTTAQNYFPSMAPPPPTTTASPITITHSHINQHNVLQSTPIARVPSPVVHSFTPVSTASSFPYSIGSIITLSTHQDTFPTQHAAASHHDSQIKQKIQTIIEGKIGVAIPDNCVLLSSLDLTECSISSQLHQGEQDGENQNDHASLCHGFEFEDERVESLTENDMGIAKWLRQVNVNCDRLRQLSITSDAIHCIEYCCNKIRFVLDDASEEINRYEEVLDHKAHIMKKIKRKWFTIQMQSREASLYHELSASYKKDIKGTLTGLEECAHNIFDRFYDVCSTKLDRLAFRGKLPTGGNDLYQLFKTDVDVFTDEMMQCSGLAHSNLLFLNMQSVLQRKYRKLGLVHSLERLAEDFLNFEANGEDFSSRSSESSGYCHDDSNVVSINVASIFPCSLQTMDCNSHLKSESVKEVLYSVLQCLVSRNQTEMKKYKRCFVTLCSQHLQSDHTEVKSVQYHVDLMSGLIAKHLRAFQDLHAPQFKDIYQQLEMRVADLKQMHKITEMQLKHLINLKVYLEVQKSHFSYCLKYN